jgi:hypothetical protein
MQTKQAIQTSANVIRITHVLHEVEGLQPGYCILSLSTKKQPEISDWSQGYQEGLIRDRREERKKIIKILNEEIGNREKFKQDNYDFGAINALWGISQSLLNNHQTE